MATRPSQKLWQCRSLAATTAVHQQLRLIKQRQAHEAHGAGGCAAQGESEQALSRPNKTLSSEQSAATRAEQGLGARTRRPQKSSRSSSLCTRGAEDALSHLQRPAHTDKDTEAECPSPSHGQPAPAPPSQHERRVSGPRRAENHVEILMPWREERLEAPWPAAGGSRGPAHHPPHAAGGAPRVIGRIRSNSTAVQRPRG